MNDDKIVEILEGQNVDEDKIVEILDQLREEHKTVVPNFPSDNYGNMVENEEDPLKRAALVAGKISRSFDE